MTTSQTERRAVIHGGDIARVAAYLPSNYQVAGWDDNVEGVVIVGSDSAGWTLDDYVLPRLASGCMFGKEVTS